jgi:hypothetical protein
MVFPETLNGHGPGLTFPARVLMMSLQSLFYPRSAILLVKAGAQVHAAI